MHASRLNGLGDIDEAVFALAVGAGAAFVGGGLLAVSGHYAWGMQTYKNRPPGTVPPLLPFGLGKSIDACGQGEIPLDEREECHCGGPSGGDSGREPGAGCCAGSAEEEHVATEAPGAPLMSSTDKPMPMHATHGRPCYIVCCCCATTDDEPRFISKWRIQNILAWTMCFPLALCGALRRWNKVTRKEDMGKPDPHRRPTSLVRELLWWTVCFPFAFINYRFIEGGSERTPYCCVDLCRWIVCFPCSFLEEARRVRARYAISAANGEPGPNVDYGPMVTRQRIANCVFWLACCPYAYLRSAGRRYNETVRAWYEERGDLGSAPDPAPRKNAPFLARELAFNCLCFPYAFLQRRLRYGSDNLPPLIIDLLLWLFAPCIALRAWLKRARADDEVGTYEVWPGEAEARARPPFVVRVIAALRGTSAEVAENYRARAADEASAQAGGAATELPSRSAPKYRKEDSSEDESV
jgi:hypothetical protein